MIPDFSFLCYDKIAYRQAENRGFFPSGGQYFYAVHDLKSNADRVDGGKSPCVRVCTRLFSAYTPRVVFAGVSVKKADGAFTGGAGDAHLPKCRESDLSACQHAVRGGVCVLFLYFL